MAIVEELLDHVRQWLQQAGVCASSRLLCAVSGGVDSVVLLDLLRQLSSSLGFALGIAHADHSLRGEQSRREASFVEQLAVEHGLPILLEVLPVRQYARQHRCSIELAARRLRYDFFARAAQQFSATHLALAHTADDNAETILLNLLRGAGLEGLAGIPPQRELLPGCQLIRPLLAFRKQQLYAYAHARRLQWCEDTSNRDRRFRRNRIRWELLPCAEAIVPQAVLSICRAGTLLRQALEGIAQVVEPYLQRAALPDGGFFFREADWDALPPFFRAELLRAALRRLGSPYGPPFDRLTRALALRTASTGKRCMLTRDATLVRERTGLSLLPLTPALPELLVHPRGRYRLGMWELEFSAVTASEVDFSADASIAFVDADCLPDTLCWRPPRAGDRFHPLGMPREMKLGDFLTNQRLPYWRRRSLTVLAVGSRILWVCGLRLSETVKLTERTRRILRLHLRHVPPAGTPAHARTTA